MGGCGFASYSVEELLALLMVQMLLLEDGTNSGVSGFLRFCLGFKATLSVPALVSPLLVVLFTFAMIGGWLSLCTL